MGLRRLSSIKKRININVLKSIKLLICLFVGFVGILCVRKLPWISPHGDAPDELSGNYYYRQYRILWHSSYKKFVPAEVISYNYDKNFILAAQKPIISYDSLFKGIVYKDGTDRIYFWLIIHKEYLILGPMIEEEYQEARMKYGVPSDLKLKRVKAE